MRHFFTNKFIFLAVILTLFARFANGADTIINTDTTKVGRKVSSGDKKLEFDTNSGANNPAILTTPANNDLRLKTNKVKLGTGAAADQELQFNTGVGTPPAIKWNNTTAKLEFTNDGTNFKGIGSGSGGGGSGLNLIENSGFEDGTLGFTSSGGVTTVVTAGSNLLAGLKSVTFDAAAGSQYFESNAIAIPEFLKGRNCLARVHYKGADANLKFQVLDGSNVAIATEQVFSAQTVVTQMQQSFICPTSGSMKFRVVSTADAALIALDQVHIGENDQLVQLSQASHVGTLKYDAAANCSWSVTTTTFTSYSADTDCSVPTVTGLLSAPPTKIPAFKMNVVAGSVYRITIKGQLNQQGSYIANWRLTDGTDFTEISGLAFAVTGTMEGIGGTQTTIYKPTTSGEKVIELQGKSDLGTTGTVIFASETPLVFEVEQFPSQSQLAINSVNSNFGWTDGGVVTIEATTSNPTKGTTTTDKSWFKRSGDSGEFRFEFVQTVAGTAGSGDYIFKLPNGLQIDTTKVTVDATIIGFGAGFNARNSVGSCIASKVGTTTHVGVVMVYDSTHVRCVGTDQTQSAAVNAAHYGLGSDMSYSFSFKVPITGWNESQLNMPILVGGISTGSSGSMRFEYATISAAGIVSNESSDWISGDASLSDTSLYALTLNSGKFSSSPVCWGTGTDTGGFAAYLTIASASSTSVTARTGNHLPSVSQQKVASEFNIFCMGPK